MNEFIDFITANTTIAYVTAFIIFIITLVLVVRRLIGFMITLLLLVFALLSGLSIANHDLFREMLQKFKTDTSHPEEDKTTYYKNQLLKAYEDLKKEFEELKIKWESTYEYYKSTHSKEKESKSASDVQHE